MYFHLLAQSKQTNKQKNSSLLKTSSIWFATYDQGISDTHILQLSCTYQTWKEISNIKRLWN